MSRTEVAAVKKAAKDFGKQLRAEAKGKQFRATDKQYQSAIEELVFICWGWANECPSVYIYDEKLADKFGWKTEKEWIAFFNMKIKQLS